MAKNYKLQSKNKLKGNTADGRFTVQTGYFRRYVTSKGGGVAIIVLESLSLILTTIFALVLGIFGSVYMSGQYDFTPTDTMTDSALQLLQKIEGLAMPANTLWLISSIIYIIGTLALFLGFCRIAAGIHLGAAVMTVVSHSMIMSAHHLMGSERDPAVIMLPCIFIAIISIIIVMIVHIPRWLDRKIEKDNAASPSIIQEDD